MKSILQPVRRDQVTRALYGNGLVPCSLTRRVQARVARRRRRRRHGRRDRTSRACVPRITLFLLSTVFLQRCRRLLTRGRDEQLVAVTGVETGGTVVPCLIMPLAYEHSSPVGVAADREATARCLRTLTRSGHRVLAMAHSHPGTGRFSVCESATDVAAQARFEQAGYEVVTLIFSRDGFVRAFSNKFAFRAVLFGSGAVEVDHHVFKID